MSGSKPVIAVLGGTGKEGSGLALRWAHAGYDVIIGTRNPEKGAAVVAELNGRLGRSGVRSAGNLAAADAAAIVTLAVPYMAQRSTAEEVRPALAGKILIDVTVPLVPPQVGRVQLPDGRSAAEAVQALLGPEVRVVAAFQNVSATHLRDLAHEPDCDVLVCADDASAAETVLALAAAAGMRAFHAGPLANAIVPEGLTSVLININRRFKIAGAGIRITGLPEKAGSQ